MYIVQGEQAEAEYLVGHEEMSDVGAAESSAGRAIAIGVERPGIGPEFSALDVEPPVARERSAVSSHSRRGDAVEQVDAAANAFDQVLGKPDAHQIARVSLRQRVVDDFDHLVHGVLVFPDGQSANSESIPI